MSFLKINASSFYARISFASMECERISLEARVEVSDKHREYRNIQLTLIDGYYPVQED